MKDHYRCSCGKLFYRTGKALDHKIETKHKIFYVFGVESRGITKREAFAPRMVNQ